MESRWIYREIEETLKCGRPLKIEYPHSFISKQCRFRVLDIDEVAPLLRADYIGKAIWYANSKDPSGARRVNEARDAMFNVFPFLRPRDEKQKESTEANRGAAEELMHRFIEREKARKEAETK